MSTLVSSTFIILITRKFLSDDFVARDTFMIKIAVIALGGALGARFGCREGIRAGRRLITPISRGYRRRGYS